MPALEDLHDVLQRRRLSDSHAAADTSLVMDSKWQDGDRHIFFYGIAHLLKHRARSIVLRLLEERADGQNSTVERQALLRTMGWIEEFLWLSIWARYGLLRGSPKVEEYKDSYDLLFLALVHMEWGDLLREASYINRAGWVSPAITTENRTNTFEVWKPDPGSTLAHDLPLRAEKRYGVADDSIRRLDRYFDPDTMVIGESIRDIYRSINLGFARVLRVASDGSPDVAMKHLLASMKYFSEDVDANLADLLLAEADEETDWDEVSVRKRSPFDQSLVPVHILAEWIEDILTDPSIGYLHPRLSLDKNDMPANQEIKTFPDTTSITRLQNSISTHLKWLKFVTQDRTKYLDHVDDIEKKDAGLHAALYDVKAQQEVHDLDQWKLYVLRDYGSFTPLLPACIREKIGSQPQGRSRGGGYFLRGGTAGIVIDPGFNYIEHFYEAELDPSMITHVVVTHDHYDHSASFGPLLNLLFKHRRESQKAKRRLKKISFLLSRGVLDQFARFIVDLGYFDELVPLTDSDEEFKRIHQLADNPQVKLRATHTEHGMDNGFGKGVGLLFTFDGLPTLGITSDTGWYEGLADIFSQCEVLVLHVGSLKRSELRDSTFYKTHLGARGVFRTIEAVEQCRLAVLSEFGEECRGHRRWFAGEIEEYFRGQESRPRFECIPSDRKTVIVGKAGGEIEISRREEPDSGVEQEWGKATPQGRDLPTKT